MENRNNFLWQFLLSLLICTFFSNVQLKAQLDFTFNYTGPDTLFVDESCTAILDWGAPGSISAACNNPGCMITFFEVFSITGGYTEGDSLPAGIKVLITYYVQDNQGNDAFFGFDIDVVDTLKPMFDSTSMPMNLDVSCLNEVPDPPAIADLVATDNCPPANAPPVDVMITYEGQSDTIPLCESGTFTRTWIATDQSGNTAEYVQTITITADNDPPVITGFPESLTEACDTADYLTWIMAQRAAFIATDAGCGIDTTYDDAPATFESSCDSVTVTFTAEDGCGMTTSTQATYSVFDNTNPFIVPPSTTDITIECDGSPADPFTLIDTWSDSLTVADNCDEVSWSNDFTDLTGGCGGSTGEATVTYTAADACNNSSSISLHFMVIDNTPPSIDNPPLDTTVACDGQGNGMGLNSWLNNLGGASVSDVCSNPNEIISDLQLDGMSVTMSQIQDSLNNQLITNCGASISITFSFTDACGNESTAPATFTVTDNLPPVWDIDPTPLEVECDGSVDPAGAIAAWLAANGNGSATDACGSVAYSHDFMTLSDECGRTGNASVTFTATDNCGNTATRMATVNVVDTSPPVWNILPTNLDVECDSNTDPTAAINTWLSNNGNGQAFDDCGTGVVYTNDYNGLTPGCGATGNAIVTFTATDSCGLSATQTAAINITDTTPPEWMVEPDSLIIQCDGGTDPNIAINNWLNANGNGSASDACSGAVIYENDYQGLSNGCNGATGSTAVTFTATDSCGNASSRTVTLAVIDDQPPAWNTDPTDLFLNCDGTTDISAAINAWLNNDGNGAASDNCSQTIIIHDYQGAAPGCTPATAVVVNFTAMDECMNAESRSANIMILDSGKPVIDVPAANISVDCENPSITFTDWVAGHGGATASDFCYTINNTPGSGDWTSNAMAPVAGCGNTYNQTVTFTVSDNCGNTATTVATYTVVDNNPPVFDFCPTDITVGATAGNCEAQVSLEVPVISDPCSSSTGNEVINANAAISSNVPGNTLIPVNAVTLTFTGIPTPPVAALDPVSLDIILNNVDAEQATEYFNILGEDGSFLGQTNNSASQCGNATTNITIPVAVFNNWTTDGVLEITLDPNIPATQTGDFAINDICPAGNPNGGGSSVDGILSYNSTNPDNLMVEYQVDGNAPVSWDPLAPVNLSLSQGSHAIVYYATDCSGNQSSCAYVVTVEDQEAPTITCPADTILNLGPSDDCTAGLTATLPLPTGIFDNCEYGQFSQTQPFTPADALLTFSYDPNYQNYIADDKVYNFVATAANAVGNNVILTVMVEGDVADPDAYFTIHGEDGSVLGVTEASQGYVSFTPGDCMANPVVHPQAVATIPIPVATYNSWAANGVVTITAVSNTTFPIAAPGGPSDGINPSCTTFSPGTPDGENDGASNITIRLDVNTGNPYYYTTGATIYPNTNMLPPAFAPTLNFALGETEVYYVIADQSGNEDTCSFMVSVQDAVAPVAACQATTIFVNPSGLDTYTLDPAEIENGSTDNCEVVDYSVFPNTFDCSMAGTSVNVTLVVQDAAGNADSCTVLVAVETEEPMPAYSIGLCGNDTLTLFANPPPAQGAMVYTFLWSGPQGFISTDENPFIPNVDSGNSGTYTVQVTGLTGCTALGTVEVSVTDTPNTPVISANSNDLCTTDDLVLTTQQYSGGTVSYHWYAGIYPGGTFIATTSIPTHTLFAPLTPVTNTYYVIVEVDGCVSDASFYTTVNVTEAPVATTNDALLQLCEGETFAIGTMTNGPGYSYSWTGPNGFLSDQANPPAFDNATNLMAGVYQLIVSANGCPSDPVTTVVNITPQPAQPTMSSPGLVCTGDSVTFVVNNTGADFYGWVAPDFSTTTTLTNTLTIPSASIAFAGEWSVYINVDGCNSELSEPVLLFVEPPVDAQATNDGPVCEGSPIQLSASSFPGASYLWAGPDGFTSAMQNPQLNAVGGLYSVTVTASSGCTGVATTMVDVNIIPEIIAANNSGMPCVSGAEDITLSVDVSPADTGSYTYQWTGPNGYSSVSSTPVLPNGTSADNGSYIVVVTTAEGCSSTPMETVVNVADTPASPAISGLSEYCEGETIVLSTSEYIGTDVAYVWVTPNDTISTTSPNLQIDTAATSNSGSYQLYVVVDGCPSNFSSVFEVTVFPTPVRPVISVDSVICSGTTIQFNTPLIAGATYVWTGPGGFTSDIHNPVIFNASTAHEGSYTVQVFINGCSSPMSIPINIQVTEGGMVATALNDGPICIDAPGATLTLSVSPASATPGANYTWYDALTNQVVAGPTLSLTASVNDFTDYGEGTFDFYVVSELNGCSSLSSVPTSVVFNTIPNTAAYAGDPISVCNLTAVTLDALEPTVGTGTWTQIDGPLVTIANPDAANTVVNDLEINETYVFQWTLSNGACTDYSSDQVTVSIYGDTEQADAGLNIELCNASVAPLSASPSMLGNTGSWSQTPAQQAMGVVITDPGDATTTATGLTPGEVYEFTWTLSNPGCGDFSAASVLVEIIANANVAFAGLDFEDCGDGIIQLQANAPGAGQGTWTSEHSDLVIVEPNNPNTLVEGLTDSGEYTFLWSVNTGACGVSSDQVTVYYEAAPEAMDDEFVVPYAGSIALNVKTNDLIANPFTIEPIQLPAYGQLSITGPGEFVFTADPTYAGEDEFTYELCSQTCPDVCAVARVQLLIGEDAACDIPTIFTPNNDLVNDSFIIPCLATEEYPDNVVSIFNQWGDEVFRAAPYQNDWQGTYKGEDVPVGTYYFVVDFGKGQEPKAGFLILER